MEPLGAAGGDSRLTPVLRRGFGGATIVNGGFGLKHRIRRRSTAVA